MALENFKPEIWSAKVLVRLRKNLVFSSIVNTDYEGEIRAYGDVVKINELGDVTVNDYTEGATLTYQTMEGAQKELKIDQGKYFAVSVDDVTDAQTNPKLMNAIADNAAYQIGDGVDQFIAGLYAGAGCAGSATYTGSDATHLSVSSGNVIETLSYISRYMDEGNISRGNRWGVVAPWFVQKLVLAETGGISAAGVPKVGTDGILVAGYVGRAMGIDLYMSNNCSYSSTADYRFMFGTRNAISFAGQIAKVEYITRETTFDKAVRGLYVYGAKVVKSQELFTAYLVPAAG